MFLFGIGLIGLVGSQLRRKKEEAPLLTLGQK
jgi:hypothetical protein